VNYQLDTLYRHTEQTAKRTRHRCTKEINNAKEAFRVLSSHFNEVSKETNKPEKNIKLSLITRFINHLLSYFLLIERGLILDAVNSSRSAVETTAFYWLVCVDKKSLHDYVNERSPRPVDVRKKLEEIGIDVSQLKERYSRESAVCHVGNPHDQLQINWEKGNSGKLLVGGGGYDDLRRKMFLSIGNYVAAFLKHDTRYEVSGDPFSV